MTDHPNPEGRLGLLASMAALVILASGCGAVDPEYAQRLHNARTDCTGSEITGIWVSKVTIGNSDVRTTRLFRPDGTVVGRVTFDGKTYGGQDSGESVAWKYLGGGLWQVQTKDFSMSIRYDGAALLIDSTFFQFNRYGSKEVMVRGDEEWTVDRYLENRR